MTRKQFLEVIKQAGFSNVISKRDGTFELRRGYFYRMGMSGSRWGEAVMSKLPEGMFELVSTGDKWASWPKESYFSAFIRPVTENVVHGVDKANKA